MTRNTIICAKCQGRVDVVIEVNVKGHPDAIARIDRGLASGIRNYLRPFVDDQETDISVNGQTIPEQAETSQAFEDAMRKP